MIDSICVIVKRPPGDEHSTLGVRTCYATLMSSMESKLLFMGQGIYNLLENPGYNTVMLKEIVKEEGEVWCIEEDLKGLGLSRDRLIDGVRVVAEGEVPEIVEGCQSVAVF